MIIFFILLYQLDPLKPGIDNVWLFWTGNNFGFWTHECKEHGSCSRLLPYTITSSLPNIFMRYHQRSS